MPAGRHLGAMVSCLLQICTALVCGVVLDMWCFCSAGGTTGGTATRPHILSECSGKIHISIGTELWLSIPPLSALHGTCYPHTLHASADTQRWQAQDCVSETTGVGDLDITLVAYNKQEANIIVSWAALNLSSERIMEGKIARHVVM